MKIFNPSFSHRTLFSLFVRSLKILKRYGLSTKKMQWNLKLYLSILEKHGITPTFPITANVLNNHSALIRSLVNGSIQFAIHGYEHIDYTGLSYTALSQHLMKAVRIFQEHNIPFSGFRSPYLKWNSRYAELLKELSLQWDSSDSILWDVVQGNGRRKRDLANYQYMLSKYNYKRASEYFSLPKFNNGILQIPVSLPDDDLLIDRLGINDENILLFIWTEMLKETYFRGELFTLQLHPERIPFLVNTLKGLIDHAVSKSPEIWVASLSSIFNWWKEKQDFWIDLKKMGNDEYKVDAHCSDRATVLIKLKHVKKGNLLERYTVVNGHQFIINSRTRPVIGVPPKTSPALIEFLKNEGFVFQIDSENNGYSLFLDDMQHFRSEDEIRVLQKIDQTNAELIRFWRWPKTCQSAFAITGDIDALSIRDFFMRNVH